VVTRNPGFLKSTKIGSVFTVFDKIGPVLKTTYSTVANRFFALFIRFINRFYRF
jgi:hypothetical protein